MPEILKPGKIIHSLEQSFHWKHSKIKVNLLPHITQLLWRWKIMFYVRNPADVDLTFRLNFNFKSQFKLQLLKFPLLENYNFFLFECQDVQCDQSPFYKSRTVWVTWEHLKEENSTQISISLSWAKQTGTWLKLHPVIW